MTTTTTITDCTPAALCEACLAAALAALATVPWDCIDTATIDAALAGTMDGCGTIVTVTTTTTHRVTASAAAEIVADAAAGVRGCGARGQALTAHADAIRRSDTAAVTTITLADGTIVAG
jgi:Cu/Ag efflux protein CusF